MKRPWRKPRQDISPRPRRYEVLQDAAPEPETVPIGAYPYHPAPVGPARPPRVHQADVGGGWNMTMVVDTDVPAGPMNKGVRDALQFLELEVADIEHQLMGYRIDDAERARRRGENPGEMPPVEELDEQERLRLQVLAQNSLIAQTVTKAVRHLMSSREPLQARAQPEPWYHPADPSGVRAAAMRAFGGGGAA